MFELKLWSEMFCLSADWIISPSPVEQWPRLWPSSAAVPIPSSTPSLGSPTSDRTASPSWLGSLRERHWTKRETKRVGSWVKTLWEPVMLTPQTARDLLFHRTGDERWMNFVHKWGRSESENLYNYMCRFWWKHHFEFSVVKNTNKSKAPAQSWPSSICFVDSLSLTGSQWRRNKNLNSLYLSCISEL